MKRILSYLNKLSIHNRLVFLCVALGILLFICINGINMYLSYSALMEEKQHQLEATTEMAVNVIENYEKKAEKGELTEAEAQNLAKNSVANMLYSEGTGYLWINDYNVTMVMHPTNKELNGKDLSDFKDQKGTYLFKELTEQAKSKGEGTVTYYWTKPGKGETELFPKLSYGKAFDKWQWVVATGIYIDDVNQVLLDSIIKSLVISTLILVLAILACNKTFVRSIVEPIRHIAAISKELANKNLAVEIPKDDNNTEIGELYRSFDLMAHNFRSIVAEMASMSESLTAGAQEMHSSSDECAQGSQQVAYSIEQVSNGATHLANNAQQTLENVNKIDNAIKIIQSNVDHTLKGINYTSETAVSGKGESVKAIEKINQIKHSSQSISKSIHELGTLGAEIEVIVELIKNIANQTNLLALNAAIEAARAGEHGKGFAVVAEEVKKLATESVEATDKITTMVKEIQAKTEMAVISMDKGTEEVNSGVEIVEGVGSSLESILTAIKNVSGKIQEITTEVSTLGDSSQDVVHMIEEVSSVSEETAASVEEISSISEEQTANINTLSQGAHDVAKAAENLTAMVTSFKL